MSKLVRKYQLDLGSIDKVSELVEFIRSICVDDWVYNYTISDDEKVLSLYVLASNNDEADVTTRDDIEDKSNTVENVISAIVMQYPALLINDYFSPFFIQSTTDFRVLALTSNTYTDGDMMCHDGIIGVRISNGNEFYIIVSSDDAAICCDIKYAGFENCYSSTGVQEYKLIISDTVPVDVREYEVREDNTQRLSEYLYSMSMHSSAHRSFQSIGDDMKLTVLDTAAIDTSPLGMAAMEDLAGEVCSKLEQLEKYYSQQAEEELERRSQAAAYETVNATVEQLKVLDEWFESMKIGRDEGDVQQNPDGGGTSDFVGWINEINRINVLKNLKPNEVNNIRSEVGSAQENIRASTVYIKEFLEGFETIEDESQANFLNDVADFNDKVLNFRRTMEAEFDDLVERYNKYHSEQFRMVGYQDQLTLRVSRKEKITFHPAENNGAIQYDSYSNIGENVYCKSDDLELINSLQVSAYDLNEGCAVFLDEELNYPFKLISVNGGRIAIEVLMC